MNEWQLMMQIRHILRAAVWPGGSNKVWGNNVYVTAGPTEDAIPQLPVPFVLVQTGRGQADPTFQDDSQHYELDFEVTLCQAIQNDVIGESPLLGAGRPDETKSRGMGLLELQDRLFDEVSILNQSHGINVQNRARSHIRAGQVSGYGYAVFRDYSFQALIDIARLYPPPLFLKATAASSSSMALTWKLAAARFDRLGLVLRRATGSTAPATSSAGTGVTVGATDVAVTDTGLSSSTQYSYSLFQTYDERTPQKAGAVATTVTDTSDAVTASGTTS